MKLYRNLSVVLLAGGLVYSGPTMANTVVAVPDSTALNLKDANGTTKTPLDQMRGSEKDIETTRQIRQALMDDEALSTNARNVKVITLKNKVTLRGAVNSSDELKRVVTIAKKQPLKTHTLFMI